MSNTATVRIGIPAAPKIKFLSSERILFDSGDKCSMVDANHERCGL
jgi:hypothetical protein